MVDLVGIQIKDLQITPSVSGTTEFPLQRSSVNKAEKATLQNLLSWILVSNDYVTNINTNVNSKMTLHTNASDPHGDRAYANSILTTHTGSTDPHGDRAFASSAITSAITAHISASDPHGDRSYTNTQITNHANSTDPHGDRAFATSVGTSTLASAQSYTNTQITTEFNNRVGTSIVPLNSGKILDTYINKELSFSSYASFPSTGQSAVRLYVDTTGNKLYRWNGSAYVNMTPTIDTGSLNLTTNDIPAGTNTDRQYLTSAKDTAFTNKVSDVINETVASSTGIFSRKVSNVVYLKTLKSEGNVKLSSNSNSVSIYDNKYTYSANSSENVELTFNGVIRTDVLASYTDTKIFNIKGEVFVYCPVASAGSTILTETNIFSVNARTALLGVTEAVPPVSTASIDNTGVTLTGSGLANSTLEIYDKTYTLITTKAINALGNFSHTFSPPRINGDPIYLYVKTPSNERSTKYTLYAPNTSDLKDITGVSVSSDGLTVRGKAERLSTVELFNSVPTSLGTATVNSSGYFQMTLSSALTDTENFTMESYNALGATSNTYTDVADLKATLAAYEININNERTTVSGKGPVSGSVSIYNDANELIISLPINSSGVFIGTLPTSASTLNIFKFVTEDSSVLSQTVKVVLTPKLTMQTPPAVIPVIIDSVYDFIYKDVTKRYDNTNFGFDVEIDDINDKLILRGTNNLNKSAKWVANLEITVEDI